MDKRLRERTTFSPRQKGLVFENGGFNNVHILNEVIAKAKPGIGVVVVQLDLSEAFDTIPHQAIGPALKRHGIPQVVTESILAAYKNLKTTIQHQGTNIEVALRRGVKQCNPLSPFIFNALLNPLLDQLESLGGYTIDKNNSISCLVFTGDLTASCG
jgi:hypothetical protein